MQIAALGAAVVLLVAWTEFLVASRPAVYVPVGLVLCSFVWAGTESLRQWSMARRRLRLGFADPVVVNRFLLCGLIGTLSAATAFFGVLLIEFGGDGRQMLLTLATSLAVVGNGVLLWLLLLPPKTYTRWVSARASA